MRILLVWAMMLLGLASAAQQPPAKDLAYEVVAIRPNTTGRGDTYVNTNADTYKATNVELKSLLLDAYDLQLDQQLLNLPAWTDGKHFDFNAKMDADTGAQLNALKPKERQLAENKMLVGILMNRFGLKAHHEVRELPEYALVEVKGGSKLKAADPKNPKANGMTVNNAHMEAYSADMSRMANFLCNQVHRPVVDRTGLAGKFDFALDFTPDYMMNSSADGVADKAPNVFTALQQQLGLKLESIKGPVDVVVIDHLDPPTEN